MTVFAIPPMRYGSSRIAMGFSKHGSNLQFRMDCIAFQNMEILSHQHGVGPASRDALEARKARREKHSSMFETRVGSTLMIDG